MKKKILASAACVLVASLLAGSVYAQGPVVTHTVTIHFDWTDYRVVTGTSPITITHNLVRMEMRKDGVPLARLNKSAPDCEAVYVEGNVPEDGQCGSALTFTFTLPYVPGLWEERVKAVFVDQADTEYAVPVLESLGLGEDGFYLIDVFQVGEWYETCPVDPDTPTPAPVPPTHTPQSSPTPLPTYTPQWTPTCRATATTVPPPTPYPTDTPYPPPTPYPTDTPYPPQP